MNRKQLLDRLLQLQAEGADMELPVFVRSSRKVVDKRRRGGVRFDYVWHKLNYVASGDMSFSPASNGLFKAAADAGAKVRLNVFGEVSRVSVAELSAEEVRS